MECPVCQTPYTLFEGSGPTYSCGGTPDVYEQACDCDTEDFESLWGSAPPSPTKLDYEDFVDACQSSDEYPDERDCDYEVSNAFELWMCENGWHCDDDRPDAWIRYCEIAAGVK